MDAEEIEVKFLDVDVPALVLKLDSLGARKVAEFDYKRKLYDFPDGRLGKDNAWLRVRKEGEKTILAYKQRFGVSNDSMREGGTREIETEVASFEKIDSILSAIGLEERIYKENKRVRYVLDEVEIDIDTWPLIPTYVELEGKSWEAVESLAKKLGFDWNLHIRGTNMQIYASYGIDEESFSVLTFGQQVKK